MPTRSNSSIISIMEFLQFVSLHRRPPNLSLGKREPFQSPATIIFVMSVFEVRLAPRFLIKSSRLFRIFIWSININNKKLLVTYVDF